MTPQATAIAGFALAVFSMLGQGSWTVALTALFWGSNYAVGAAGDVMAGWGLGCLLMAGMGLWLAHRALRVSSRGWESHLARTAVMIGAVGALLAMVTIIGGLLH